MAKKYYSGVCFAHVCGRCDSRSLHTNLSLLKRVCLSLLLVLVHMVYKTDAYGYAVYAYRNDCDSYCKSNGYYFGGSGYFFYSTFSSGGITSTNMNASSCYCVTSIEYSSIKACIASTTCAANYSYASGHGTYDMINAKCTVGPGCYCKSGYYRTAYGYGACTVCPVGYYCPGNSTMGVSGAGRVACASGYYCSTTGASTGLKCPARRYTSTTAQSTCSWCVSGYYCPGGTSVICPVGYYCPTGSMSSYAPCPTGYYCSTTGLAGGTKCPAPNPPATTVAGYVPTAVGNCYLPANTDITEDGEVGTYVYTSNCYYGS